MGDDCCKESIGKGREKSHSGGSEPTQLQGWSRGKASHAIVTSASQIEESRHRKDFAGHDVQVFRRPNGSLRRHVICGRVYPVDLGSRCQCPRSWRASGWQLFSRQLQLRRSKTASPRRLFAIEPQRYLGTGRDAATAYGFWTWVRFHAGRLYSRRRSEQLALPQLSPQIRLRSLVLAASRQARWVLRLAGSRP